MSYGTTRQEKRLYDFIVAYNNEKGYPPSFQEMTDGVGLRSKSGIHRLIVALEERGKIARLRNRARSVVPVDDNIFLRLPVELQAELNEYSLAVGISKNEIITRAIAREISAARVAA